MLLNIAKQSLYLMYLNIISIILIFIFKKNKTKIVLGIVLGVEKYAVKMKGGFKPTFRIRDNLTGGSGSFGYESA